MDIKCATCKEPWDHYHLLEDEVHETEAGIELINHKIRNENSLFPELWTGEVWEKKLTPFWREQFAANGWKFGSNVCVVFRCPCCKDNKAEPDEQVEEDYKTLDCLLEGDLDGLIVEMSDYGNGI